MFSAKTFDVLSSLTGKTAALQQDSGLTPEQRAASAARGLPLSGPASGADDYSWMTRGSTDTAAFAGAFTRLHDDQAAQRNPLEMVTDTAAGAAGGAMQGFTSLYAIPDNLLFGGNLGSREMSQDLQALQNNFTSETQQRHNEAYGSLHEAHNRDFDRRGIHGWDRVQQEMAVTGDLLLENPNQITQGVANAGGSLLAGGLVSKGIRGVLTGAGAIARNPAVVSFIARHGDKVAGALGMGGMEAGGAGLQAAQAVDDMSHEQLLEGSDFYATYLEVHGDTEEARAAAKQAVGARAGNVAALVQAPAALLGGALTGKILQSPFRAGSVREALANVGKETMEEAMQEGMGNFSTNVGVRTFADRNQALEEGVGRGAVEGAAFGGLSAGTMQLPGTVARRGAERTVETVQGLMAKGAATNSANDVNADIVAAEAVKAAAQPVVMPEVPVTEDGTEAELDADTAELMANIDAVNALGDQFRFDVTTHEPASAAESNVIASLDPNEEHDVFDVMSAASVRISQKDVSPEEKLELAEMIHGLQSRVTEESMALIGDLQSKATPGGTLASETARMIKGQEAVKNNMAFRQAMIDGLNATPDVKVEDVEDISTPEGAQAARKVALQAVLTPENIDPEVVERLLKHSTGNTFTPRQTNALRSTAALNQTLKAATASAEKLGVQAPAPTRVATDIQSANYVDSANAGPSVKGHYALINEQASMGLKDDAKASLAEFRNFAQHMANKLSAVNESFNGRLENGFNPEVFYEAYNSQTKEWYTPKKGWTAARFDKTLTSQANSQQIGVDAEYVIDSFNALVDQHPDLGIQKIEPVRLDAGLQKPARQVFEEAKRTDFAQKNPQAVKAKKPEQAMPAAEKVAEEKLPVQDPADRLYTSDQVKSAKDKSILTQIENIEYRRDFGTPFKNDDANLAMLEAERDRREAALVAEIEETQELPDQQGTVPTNDQPIMKEAAEEVAEPEAKPEVQATEEVADAEQQPAEQRELFTVEETFPDVVKSTDGVNLLHDGFTLDNESKTRLVGKGALNAMQIAKALADPDAFHELTGMVKSKLSPPVTAAYMGVLQLVSGKVFSIIGQRIAASKDFSRHNKGQPVATLSKEKGIKLVGLRLLNLMVRNEDGSLKFDSTVESAAILALTDWLAQHSVRQSPRSDEDIAKALDIDVMTVSDEIREGFNTGINSQQAHETLVQTLTQFLGLKAKNNVKNGLTHGLILSLAGELLDSAEIAGLIEPTTKKSIKIGDKYFMFLRVKREALGIMSKEEGAPTFAGQTTLISEAVLQDETVAGYKIGKPSGKRNFMQMGGGATTTKAQQETELREGAVPQTVNKPMLDLFNHLELDGVVKLFANGVLAPTLNINDRKSRDGQNTAFASAFQTVMGLVDHMQRAANEAGQALEETQLFREYRSSSVNRLQQQGQFGDQASKLTREIITPYATMLDLTNAADLSMWRRGIAQALGIKVEKLNPGNWEAQLAAKLGDPAILSAIQIMRDPTATPSDQLIDVLKAALDPSKKKGVTPVQVHALKSYADFLEAEEKGTLNEFFTHVYVEADGMTDGPTNSLIYMRLGGFDAEMVRGLARGGFKFSKEPVAAHEIFDAPLKEGETKPKDTYEITAQRLNEGLAAGIKAIIGTAKDARDKARLTQHAEDMLLVMRKLLGDLDFEFDIDQEGNKVFKIGRKQLKNPLTVTVYGSSPAGIAKKIAVELVSALYAEMSDANELAEQDGAKPEYWGEYFSTNPQDTMNFMNALVRLGTGEVKSFEGAFYVKSTKMAATTDALDPVNFTVLPHAVEAISSAIEHFYVGPMVDAISAGMGTSPAGSELIQRSTNMLSALAKTAFSALMTKALESHRAAGGYLSDGLSPDEMKSLLAKVAFLFPYMQSGTVTVNVKGLTSGVMAPSAPKTEPGEQAVRAPQVKAAATLSNEMSTLMTIPMPAIAGVAGAAYVNISYGDGRMIIEASPNLVGGRLMVFDGINLALKDALANGKAINASVLSAIQSGTPFSDLLKTFSEAAETIDLDQFSDEDLADIHKVASVSLGDVKLDVPQSISYLHFGLRKAAQEEMARQNTFKRVHLSSDHMAALGAPASTQDDASREDLSLLGSDELIAARLQEIYLDELAKLQTEVLAERANKPTEDIGKVFAGLPEHETGVRVTNTNRLRGMVDELNIPGFQKTLLRRAVAALTGSRWTVVLGDAKSANAYAKAEELPITFGVQKDGTVVEGVTAPARQTIIVANNSSETLVHELIHAATLDRVLAYFSNPQALDPKSREAIMRLEALMHEWLEAAPLAATLRNEKIRNTVLNAAQEVQKLLDTGQTAEALNEFMAHNLANQELNRLNSTIKVESKLAQIAGKVMAVLREMFGLPHAGKDFASNIRFNASILMSKSLPSLQSQTADMLMRHSTGTRPELDQLAQQFGHLVRSIDVGFENISGPLVSDLALEYGERVADIASMHGFNLSNEEKRALSYIVAAYRVNMVKDPSINVKINAYRRELLAQMNQTNMALGDPLDPSENQLARERIALLDGSVDVGTDINGLSLLLPLFVGLSVVSPEAQTLFNRITVRNRKKAGSGPALDTVLKSHATNMVNGLMDFTFGLKADQKVGEEVNSLVRALIRKASAEKNQLREGLEQVGGLVRKGNDKLSDFVAFGLGKASDAINSAVVKPGASVGVENAAKGVMLALDFMNKDRVEDATAKLTIMMNQNDMPPELRAIFTELMGTNEGNQDILSLVKQGRAIIDKIRQSYRDVMPQQIASKFTRSLTPVEWKNVHSMGLSDLAVLLEQGLTDGAVIDLLADPAALQLLLDQKGADIRRLFGAEASAIFADAHDLSDLMKTGVPAHGLVKRNALAIANRVGSAQVGSFAQDSDQVKAIDGFVTLLTLTKAEPSVQKSLMELAKTEKEGLRYTLSLMAQARSKEMARVPARLRFNVPKGYMPKEQLGSFKVVPMDKVGGYTRAGYRVVGSRDVGPTEALHDARAKGMVYVATDLTAPSFKQGIMRTIRSTVFGLDALTGASFDNPSAGLIIEPTAVKRITNALKNRSSADKSLAPLFNEDGQIYAYERLVDPSLASDAIQTQQNAAVSLGQWMGRQHEEMHGERLNDLLIERLADMYASADRTAQRDEFFDLAELAETDPVVADALRLISDRDMSKLFARMGGKFMVRKDLYENVVGFRAMSVGDLWTGNTRMKEEHREAIANFLTGLLGPQAYRYLTLGEQAWTKLMGDARVAIVVKSILVPALNAMANFYQLMANGIGPVQIATRGAHMLRETHLYAQKHLEHQKLEIELAAAQGARRPDLVRRIETEMRMIEDLYQRLSIWPLIEAGEFSQVTEGLTQEDMAMTNGRVWDHVSRLADKLPAPVKTMGRYALVTKDTALFEGLARTVSYTDFVAKAVLYDHLTTKGKLSKKQALLRITNEFVNYDLLGGRMRTAAEDLGLVWFWRFKLRSIKVAASLLRNNPLHTLLSSMVPGSMEAGTVMDDNGFNLVLDGRFDESTGIQNAWRAVNLNPVMQMTGG